MEHRLGQRTALKIPVRLVVGSGELFLGQMVNFSISGAFVQTPRPISLAAQLEVEVILPHHCVRRELERVAAHVTRRESDGVGIEWCDLALHSVRIVLEAMQAICHSASR